MKQTNSLLLIFIASCFIRCIAVKSSGPKIIRVRVLDGSVLHVPIDDIHTTTLSNILSVAGVNTEHHDTMGLNCHFSPSDRLNKKNVTIEGWDISSSGPDTKKTVAQLGLKHGSIITLQSTTPTNTVQSTSSDTIFQPYSINTNNNEDEKFDPFPNLAKSSSFSKLSLRSRALASTSRGSTYRHISRVREAMHTVEPQVDGSLSRVYVCRVGAARFQHHCVVSTMEGSSTNIRKQRGKDEQVRQRIDNRVALLFGTINDERVDQRKKVARTSLSTTREDEKMCQVAKVHAIWEPPWQKHRVDRVSKMTQYDDKSLLSNYLVRGVSSEKQNSHIESAVDRAIRIADYLGLRPIGWMFSYSKDNRCEEENVLPVNGFDVIVGSKLQIETMKMLGRNEGKKFVTLALDGKVGATEAFQLSDVCIQMVAENILASAPRELEKLDTTRYLSLKNPVIVSDEETTQLDSVLLLVNTAMLSHVGLYSGGENAPPDGNVKMKSGNLLAKTRKRLLSALEHLEGENGQKILFNELCDFDILLALDALIENREESKEICTLVGKYARGQKNGIKLGEHLKITLQNALAL